MAIPRKRGLKCPARIGFNRAESQLAVDFTLNEHSGHHTLKNIFSIKELPSEWGAQASENIIISGAGLRLGFSSLAGKPN